MLKNMIKVALVVSSIGCAGYLVAAGMLVPESEEETLQAFRYEKDGEVVYTSRTGPEHMGTDESTPSAYADNELIVQLAEGTSETEAKSIARENQAELVGFISITDTCQWRFDEAYSLEELKTYADELTELPQVEAAYVNFFTEYESDAMPSSESFEWKGKGCYWGYADIHADKVWDYIDDMKDSINIGVWDGGFLRNSDLDYILVRKGQGEKEADWKELEHGTHVTGIMAAICNNKIGIAGVYPDPLGEGEIYAYAYKYGDGTSVSTVQEMNDIARMLLNDTKVINKSMALEEELSYTIFREHDSDNGRSGYEDLLSMLAGSWEDYLSRLIDNGYDFLLVTSAGNASCHLEGNEGGYKYERTQTEEGEVLYQKTESEGETAVVDPKYGSAWLYIDNEKVRERILCVGAYNQERVIAQFSNMGERVDILAPGVAIYSTVSEGQLDDLDGTSQAAPYVTGAAACIWSLDERLTASEVKTLLMQEMYTDQIRESITDKDVNITKLVLNLENSMSQAKRYVDEHQEELDARTDEKGIPIMLIASVEDLGFELDFKGKTQEEIEKELRQYRKNAMIEDAKVTIENENGEVLYKQRKVLQKSSELDYGKEDNTLVNFFLPGGSYTVTIEAEGFKPLTVEKLNPKQDYPKISSYFSLHDALGVSLWKFELEPEIEAGTKINIEWWKTTNYSEKFMEFLEEELIPKYGVMPVDEICKTSNGMDAWLEPTDLQGILAIEIDDYDGDGKHEMLLIRGTCEGMDKQELFSSDDQGGGARINMEMYECDGSVKLADSRKLIPCGKYRVTYQEVQTGFFTYSNDGTVYIGIDSNFIMNETITTLALYQYRDEAFQYVKGFCRRRQGSCYEAVLTADSEPEQTNITFAPTFTEDTRGWSILEDYDDEQASDSELEENALRLNEVYYEQLKTYGLNGKDVRLLWGERQWDARTADIYTSVEGNLKVMASIAECHEYSTSTECHLFREDPAGSLDAYR